MISKFSIVLLSCLNVSEPCTWQGKQLIIPENGRSQGLYRKCPDWELADIITEGDEFLIEVCEHQPVLLLADTLTGNTRVEGYFKLVPNKNSEQKICGFHGMAEALFLENEDTSDSCFAHFHIIHGLSELEDSPLGKVLYTDKRNFSDTCNLLRNEKLLLEKLRKSEERIIVHNTFEIYTTDSNGTPGKHILSLILRLPVNYIDKIEYRNL